MLFLHLIVAILADVLVALAALSGAFALGAIVQLQGKYPHLAPADLVSAAPVFLVFASAYVLPLGVLVGTVRAYARLTGDREIAAMGAAGVRPARLVLPAVLVGLMASAVGLHLFHRVVPELHHRKRALAREVYAEPDRLLAAVASGRQVIPGWLIAYERRERDRMEGVVLVQLQRGLPIRYLAAKRGRCGYDSARRVLVVELESAYAREIDVPHRRVGRPTRFGAGRIEVGIGERLSWRREGRVRDLSTGDLLRGAAGDEVPRAEVRAEIHRRTGLGLAGVAFAFLGVPLGLLAGGLNTAVVLAVGTVPVFTAYYPALVWTDRLAMDGGISPLWVSLGPDGLAVVGAILLCLLLRGRGGRTGW